MEQELKDAYKQLKPCPVCGRLPVIYRDYSYEYSGFGAWCTIQCKPFLRKPHLKIEEGKAGWERALKYAVEHWNLFVDEGIKPNTAACTLHDRQNAIMDEIHELIEEDNDEPK